MQDAYILPLSGLEGRKRTCSLVAGLQERDADTTGFCSSALRTLFCDHWSKSLTDDTMSSVARDAAAGAARRRYRCFLRHELLAVNMATLTSCHYSAQKQPAATHAATRTESATSRMLFFKKF